MDFKSQKANITLGHFVILSLLVLVVLTSVAIMITQRNFVFDDSFITYRYAKNLAQGFGITWNAGELPVEGYTNFLLVVVLAPFIRIDFSPLTVTRVLSILAAMWMFWLLYLAARSDDTSRPALALFVPTMFLLISPTILLAMVGLETVIYTAVLFYAFLTGCRYLESGQMGFVYAFGITSFIAFLLRPEIIILVSAFTAVGFVQLWKTPFVGSGW